MIKQLVGLSLCGAVVVSLMMGPGVAGDLEATEYQLKAACLYTFLRFVHPTSTSESPTRTTATIGILGTDPFGDHFREVEGRRLDAGDRTLTVKRLGPYHRGIDLGQCDVLFICASEAERVPAILDDIRRIPVLTVSETSRFLDQGGMINLVIDGSRIRWEVNRGSAHEAGLSFSSQLLRTAVRVIEG